MSDFNPKKYTEFNKEEILAYLKKVKVSIVKGTYNIAVNRKENKEFIEDYMLSKNKIEQIIFRLSVNNFCYAVDNLKKEYKDEVLYVFCINEELSYFGEYVNLDIYIKFNLIAEDEFLFIISFHELQRPIDFLFNE